MTSLCARLASLCIALAACGPGGGGSGVDGGGPGADAGGPCTPSFDDDFDGISNQREGCTLMPPRDTDGDGTPDYQDADSDNDGVDDRWEDRNGDGIIGTCTETCADSSTCDPGYYCSEPLDGMSVGYCVSPECQDGETDPHAIDTDGDGVVDGAEGTFICNPMTEDNPMGLKPVKYVDSVDAVTDSSPNWRIALETDVVDGKVMITSPQTLDSAYVMDLPSREVAGFLVTRSPAAGENDAASAAQAGIVLVQGTGGTVIRAGGTLNMSLDGFQTVLATTLVVSPGSTDATALRNGVITALSRRPGGELTFPPTGWTGSTAGQFAVVFQTLYRTDPPQVLYMGAVAPLAAFDDPTLATGFHVDDVANGTGLTHSSNGEAIECEQFLVATVPKADIIWVVDESGSMDDDRMNVANNATSFFNKAVLAGLDFRVGVTDMDNGNGGRFASRLGGSSTGDRWLLPGELATFQAGINDPSGPDPGDGGTEHGLTNGQACINRHLPRDAADNARFRPDAQIVTIYVTDEHAEEVEDAGIMSDGGDPASVAQKTQITMLVQPYIQQYTDNGGVAHLIGMSEATGVCSGGGGELSYGYLDLVTSTGGQFGSICQPDLGPTMDAIIDDIVGASSPIQLEYVPISATIAVARDNVAVPRSRSFGWDYRASSNSIIFNNMPFDPLSPSEVVVSYRRWAEQVPVE